MQLVQHGGAVDTRVVEKFEAMDIGAPFKVILSDAVQASFDMATGEMISYSIPDLDGLLGKVVLSRILHPRKLSGADVKFVRKALGVKQKDLATKIELNPETLSRMEAGGQPLGPGSEKLLRIFALKTAFKIDRLKACDEKTRLEDAMDRVFDNLKPTSVFDVVDELVFQFSYRSRPEADAPGDKPSSEDGHWVDKAKAA
jgi:DNA-binding transcriptional regulator YiaG